MTIACNPSQGLLEAWARRKRTAHATVSLAQAGDDAKTCEGTANEVQQMVNARIAPEGDRNAQIETNVLLGIADAFLIVPWFFMDVGNAHTVGCPVRSRAILRRSRAHVGSGGAPTSS